MSISTLGNYLFSSRMWKLLHPLPTSVTMEAIQGLPSAISILGLWSHVRRCTMKTLASLRGVHNGMQNASCSEVPQPVFIFSHLPPHRALPAGVVFAPSGGGWAGSPFGITYPAFLSLFSSLFFKKRFSWWARLFFNTYLEFSKILQILLLDI